MQAFLLFSCLPVFLHVNLFVWFLIFFSVCLICQLLGWVQDAPLKSSGTLGVEQGSDSNTKFSNSSSLLPIESWVIRNKVLYGNSSEPFLIFAFTILCLYNLLREAAKKNLFFSGRTTEKKKLFLKLEK